MNTKNIKNLIQDEFYDKREYYDRIYEYIQESNTSGVSQTQVSRKFQRKTARNKAIERLIADKKIVRELVETKSRPKTYYRINPHKRHTKSGDFHNLLKYASAITNIPTETIIKTALSLYLSKYRESFEAQKQNEQEHTND